MPEWKEINENYRVWTKDFGDGTNATLLEDEKKRYKLIILKTIYRYVDKTTGSNAMRSVSENRMSSNAEKFELVVLFPEMEQEFDSLEDAMNTAKLQATILKSVE